MPRDWDRAAAVLDTMEITLIPIPARFTTNRNAHKTGQA